jgi:hypothetical protein
VLLLALRLRLFLTLFLLSLGDNVDNFPSSVVTAITTSGMRKLLGTTVGTKTHVCCFQSVMTATIGSMGTRMSHSNYHGTSIRIF